MSNVSGFDGALATPIDGSFEGKEKAATANQTIANCRYGTVPLEHDSDVQTAQIGQLGAGWYLSFRFREPNPPPDNGSDFVHMVHVRQRKQGFDYLPDYTISPALNEDFADYVRQNPGDIWIVGNEVDRGPNPGETDPENRGQGDTHPEIYARVYHEAYDFIKTADPTAQIAISGLVEVTPGRLQYLDKVWDTYLQDHGRPIPVDIWTMHVYVLPEVREDGITPNAIANVALGTDLALGRRESGGDPAACAESDVYCFAEHDDIDIFADQVVAMREWMANHGQKEKPLLLTEFSILYPYVIDGDTCFIQDEFGQCFDPSRVYDFMTNSFDYLNNAKNANLGYSLDDNRLVQQVLWFAVHTTGVGSVSNLLEDDLSTLTSLGQNFTEHTFAETPTRNLLVERADYELVTRPTEKTTRAELSVTFRNNGNTRIDEPFKVTFYKDAALTKPIGSTNMNRDVFGCASRPYVATVEWPGLTVGIHQFWVKIDSEDKINENPGVADNVGSGWVWVLDDNFYLPIAKAHKHEQLPVG